MSESAGPDASQTNIPGAKRKRRVYQACEPCRIRKAKCDRGNDDDPRPPPCGRCMRESIQSQCVLVSRQNRRRTTISESNQPQQANRDSSSPDHSSFDSFSQGQSHRNQNTFDSLMRNTAAQSSGINHTVTTKSPPDHQQNSNPPYTQRTPARSITNPSAETHPYNLQHGDHARWQRQQSNKIGDETSPRSHDLPPQRNLTDNVIHTLVSNPNDAFTILFEAAGRQDTSALNSRRQSEQRISEDPGNCQASVMDMPSEIPDQSSGRSFPTPRSTILSPAQSQITPSADTLELWKEYRFVRQGWLTAQEAISLVDLYVFLLSENTPRKSKQRQQVLLDPFETESETVSDESRFFFNLSPLSPILLDYYADHSNHGALLRDEPMLCTTIMTISSRYHALNGDRGILRSIDVHQKFWLYWKTLFMGVMCAQDADADSKTRTLGTIESFLLMTEWNARALHFPPEDNVWDYDMSGSRHDNQDDIAKSTEEVEGPARRSDRMSWMLLGSALTLAHELGVSDQRLQNLSYMPASYDNDQQRKHAEFMEVRKRRPRRLLYIYINQLASRLGWTSMIPRMISESGNLSFGNDTEKQWYDVMSRWISLTRLMKTASDMLFSSVTAKQLLQTGNYVTSLEHFGHLLEGWHKEFISLTADKRLLDILFIEFQFTRAYINSLAVQAVVERAFDAANPQTGPTDLLMSCVFEQHSVDFGFIQEVVEGSRNILKTVLALSEDGHLRFCPVRIYSRIISASILLLKATGLGTRIEEAQISLELLDRLVRALRLDPVDELHLANRFASLLETYVKAFRKRFLRAGRSRDNPSRDPLVDNNDYVVASDGQQQRPPDSQFTLSNNNNTRLANINRTMAADAGDMNGNDMPFVSDRIDYGNLSDDWMCLPLDAFDPGIIEFNNNLGARGLDFFYMGT